jgi:3-methyladenine DNA glycosylase Tag
LIWKLPNEWKPPSWWYRDKKPPNDGTYFENLTRCIFQAGLSWRTIDNKWINFMKAFHNFDPEKVSAYGQEDIKRLMEDVGIVRNRAKILATIHNAQEFGRIASENNSFMKWLDALDKSNNYSAVIEELVSRFEHVGKMTAHIFLYSVGENIQNDETIHK